MPAAALHLVQAGDARRHGARPAADVRDFAELRAQGLTQQLTAARLGVSERTAQRYDRAWRRLAHACAEADPPGVVEPVVAGALRRVVVADGACAQPGALAPDMFPDPANPAAVAAATAFCARCPVTGPCLLLARAYGAEDGVWGGMLLTPADAGQAEGGAA
jgi:Transcription factor WhiB